MNLRIAECCGSCKHVNRLKKPEDHAAHYSVAKTERWCFKNERVVTRESVCSDYEMEIKKGAVPAYKRVLAFNKKLDKIIEIKNWIVENNIEKIIYSHYDFFVSENKVYYKYNNWNSDWYLVSCKDAKDCDNLVKAYENYISN